MATEMAGPKPGASRKSPAPAAAPPDRAQASASELGLPDLARGILSREVRPRVAHIRRLAEAVLARETKGDKKKKKKDKGPAKKSETKMRKLSKIPPKKKSAN